MRKVSLSAPTPICSESHVELEVSCAYLERQSAPARLMRTPAPDVFHDSDLKPLQLARGEMRRLKSHLRAVGLSKAFSLPGTFTLQHGDIGSALSNTPLSPQQNQLAKTALSTLHRESRRLKALRDAHAYLDATIAAEPAAAPTLVPLRAALEQEIRMPEALLETLRDMQDVLLGEPQAEPLATDLLFKKPF